MLSSFALSSMKTEKCGLDWSRRVCPADAAVAHKCLTDGPSVHQADKQQRRRVLFNVSVELCVCSRQAGSSRLALIKILRIRTVNELGKYMYVCVCVCIYLLTNCRYPLSFSLARSVSLYVSNKQFTISSFVFFKPNLCYLYVTWNCLLYVYVCSTSVCVCVCPMTGCT